jgi:hypothetical protein
MACHAAYFRNDPERLPMPRTSLHLLRTIPRCKSEQAEAPTHGKYPALRTAMIADHAARQVQRKKPK